MADELRAARGTRALMKRNADSVASAVERRYVDALTKFGFTEAAIARVVAGALPLLTQGYKNADSIMRTNYRKARRDAGYGTRMTFPAAPKVNEEQVENSIRYVGFVRPSRQVGEGAGLSFPKPADVAKQVGGSAGRLVTSAGMESALNAARADKYAIGWARITQGADACYFCSMLESRGAVYEADSFKNSDYRFEENSLPPEVMSGELVSKVHDFCRCVLVPIYSKSSTIQQNADKLYATWRQVQSEYAWLARREGVDMIQIWRWYWEGKIERKALG